MVLIRATKKGKTAVFAERVWLTGQPQRYGWSNESGDVPLKKLPVEILEFAEVRKKAQQESQPELQPELKDEQATPKPKPKRKPRAKKGAKK